MQFEKIKKPMNKFLKWIPFFTLWVPFLFFGAVNRKRRDVLLFGTGTGLYHDNTRLLLEYADNRGVKNCYWVAGSKEFKELKKAGKPVVRKNSIRCAWLASRAAAFFVTVELLDVFFHILPKTKLIVLWHGTPIKKINYDTPIDTVRLKRKELMGRNHTFQRFDYLIIESEECRSSYLSSFKIDSRKIITLGHTRDLTLFVNTKKTIEKICTKYRVGDFTRKILYLPTYRDSEESNNIVLNSLLKDSLWERLKETNTCILLKLHPLAAKKMQVQTNAENKPPVNIIDVSDYPECTELFLVSDSLITDYSSGIFDFFKTGKPAFLYMPDIELYRSKRGGFYENAFKLALDNSTVIDKIEDALNARSKVYKNVIPRSQPDAILKLAEL